MSKRFYDESLKKMSVELSYAKGAVKPVAEESEIEPGRLSKWRQRAIGTKGHFKNLNGGTERN